MNKTDLLAIQAGFIARLEATAAFLGAATDTFKAINHTMTDLEAAGFHCCIEALKRETRGVNAIGGIIQNMESANEEVWNH